MRLFVKSTFIFIGIVLSVSLVLMRHYEMAFPRDPGPELDNKVRTNYLKHIDANRPQIVMLGDSTLGAGIDADKLAQQIEKSVYSISIPGSASTLWYLILKSNIAEASYKPEYVLIVFRDTILTAPGYRVHGSYFDLLDEYADHHEPLVIQNSFVNFMNPLEMLAERYFPLYASRADIRKAIDINIRYFAPALFGCNEDCTDHAFDEIFLGGDLEPKALVDAVGAAESDLYTPDQLDFDAQVGGSYLPEMIRIANENHIKLILVRVKVKTHGPDPKLDSYIESLTNYLHENHVFMLDYGNDPRLAPDLFLDPIHLNPKGQVVFTQMVADGLNDLFAKK